MVESTTFININRARRIPSGMASSLHIGFDTIDKIIKTVSLNNPIQSSKMIYFFKELSRNSDQIAIE
ncbi:MAG: hypothetical protein ACP5D6_10730 [Kosmotogaceae bacterium]